MTGYTCVLCRTRLSTYVYFVVYDWVHMCTLSYTTGYIYVPCRIWLGTYMYLLGVIVPYPHISSAFLIEWIQRGYGTVGTMTARSPQQRYSYHHSSYLWLGIALYVPSSTVVDPPHTRQRWLYHGNYCLWSYHRRPSTNDRSYPRCWYQWSYRWWYTPPLCAVFGNVYGTISSEDSWYDNWSAGIRAVIVHIA